MVKWKIFALVAGVAVFSACNRNSDNTATGAGIDKGTESYGRNAGTNTPEQYNANNTGRNVRDRSGDTLTPEDQGGSEADREISRQIRRAITSNDQLSADAKNIKVVTVNGKVTLRGPVDSDTEQQTVANLAKGISGVTSVDNQLEVKSKQ